MTLIGSTHLFQIGFISVTSTSYIQIASTSGDAGGALGLLLGLCGFNIIELLVMSYDLMKSRLEKLRVREQQSKPIVFPPKSSIDWQTRVLDHAKN
jgi:hypothetical protein